MGHAGEREITRRRQPKLRDPTGSPDSRNKRKHLKFCLGLALFDDRQPIGRPRERPIGDAREFTRRRWLQVKRIIVPSAQ
jgi:hypothetical protein